MTDDPRARSGRTTYRIADNYLAFWLSLLARYSGEIDRGLGATVAKTVYRRLDDYMGPRYEEAFRDHLRRLAMAGEFGDEVIGVGPFWTRGGVQVELDAVVLSGVSETATVIGECKWRSKVSAASLRAKLLEGAKALPRSVTEPELVVCARDEVTDADGMRTVTATDIFG